MSFYVSILVSNNGFSGDEVGPLITTNGIDIQAARVTQQGEVSGLDIRYDNPRPLGLKLLAELLDSLEPCFVSGVE